MDKRSRAILEGALLILLLVCLFPPFQLSNGQPQWGFVGSPPLVANGITWGEILPGQVRPAGIHWLFLGIEAASIFVLALSVWASVHDNPHHHGR